MYIPVKREIKEKFELLGLGKGDFWVIGRIEKQGVCSNCGHKLKYQFIVKSSDDKTFSIGSECLKKIASDNFWGNLTYRKYDDDLEEIPRIKNCKYCNSEILFISNYRGKFYPVDYRGIRYLTRSDRGQSHYCKEGWRKRKY